MSLLQDVIMPILIISLSVLLQWLVKTRKNERYRHLFFLIIALVAFSLATFIANDLNLILSRYTWYASFLSFTHSTYEIVYAVLWVLVYTLVKYRLLNRPFTLMERLQSGPVLAYKLNRYNVPVIKNEYEFARYASRSAVVLCTLLVIVSVILAAKGYVYIPLFAVFSLSLFTEAALYFGGNRDILSADDISGEDAAITPQGGDFEMLWKKYQEIWNDKYIVAWRGINREQPESNLFLLQKRFKDNSDLVLGEDLIFLYREPFYKIVTETLLTGKNVLFVAPVAEPYFLEKYESQFSILFANDSKSHGYKVEIYKPHKAASNPSLLIIQARDIIECCRHDQDWLKNTGVVVYFKANELFAESLNACTFMSDFLQRVCGRVKTLVISQDLYNLMSASEENLIMRKDTLEVQPYFSKSQITYSLIWCREGLPSYQDYLFPGHIPNDMGAEPVLLLPAIENSRVVPEFIDADYYPAEEQINEVQNNKNLIKPRVINLRLIEADITDLASIQKVGSFVRPERDKILFIRDMRNNFILTLRRWERMASESTLLHIVSLPYLFREYFGAHFEYFYSAPLPAFCPKRSQSRFNTAFSLLYKLLLFELSEHEIARELSMIDQGETPIAEKLRALFDRVFDVPNAHAGLVIHSRYEYIPLLNQFIQIQYFNLSSDQITSRVKELSTIDIKDDESGDVLQRLSYGNVYQNYLPFQIHSFNGKAYEIPAIIDRTNNSLVVNHYTRLSFAVYRPCYTLFIKEVFRPLTPDHVKHLRNITLSLLECEMTISTEGYVKFINGIKLSRENQEYAYQALTVEQVAVRTYRSARLLKIDFPPAYTEGRFLQTLSILLKEAFFSLFPDNNKYVCVTTIQQTDFSQAERCLLPGLRAGAPLALKNSLLIIEDSFEDAGAVQSIFDHWEYIFFCIDDYLDWSVSGDAEKTDEFRFANTVDFKSDLTKQHFIQGKFHNYGFEGPPPFLDIPATKSILSEILGQNPQTTKRKQFYREPFFNDISMGSDNYACDFCGVMFGFKELDTLADGRNRCKDCLETAVNQVSELESIFHEGRYFLENTMGLGDSLPSGISVRFESASEILKNLKDQTFTPTPGYDARPVGFARKNANNAYEIYIENGSPYHLTLETVVHELSHIWQFENIDVKKAKADYGDLLIEGHALWAGLKILESRKLALHYCELEKEREDVYGQGYTLLMNLLDQYPQYYGNTFDMLKILYR